MPGARASPALLLSPTSWKIELHPLAILLNEGLRTLDGKPMGECGITFQEPIDRCVVASRNAPAAVFTNQILLHNELPLCVERFVDVRIHRRVYDGEIA